MNIYLDIDGTLITRHGQPAPHLREFLEVVTARHECFWLTTHCRGGENRAEEYLRRVLPEEYWQYLKYFMPTDWNALKTEAIDFSKEFRWLDDYIFEAEKEILRKNNCLEKFIQIDLIRYPDKLNNFLQILL